MPLIPVTWWKCEDNEICLYNTEETRSVVGKVRAVLDVGVRPGAVIYCMFEVNIINLVIKRRAHPDWWKSVPDRHLHTMSQYGRPAIILNKEIKNKLQKRNKMQLQQNRMKCILSVCYYWLGNINKEEVSSGSGDVWCCLCVARTEQ